MIMQQEKNDSDDERDVSLIEYENMTMISEHEIKKHKINNYKDIAMVEHKDVRHENV